MDTGGLSGTVNIDTIHPLDYKGPHLTLTAKGYDNTYRGGVTPRWAAPISAALPMAPWA
jgi:hypothetical protein